jgi:uncharacterized peroxidase-related enzyme
LPRLPHGAALRSNLFSADEVEAIARDYRTAGLTPAEVAMMAFAQKVTRNANQVSPEDIEDLRRHGFSDEEILDVVLAAAARSFFSKVLDAVGAEPDPAYGTLPLALREVLAMGRPFPSS